ncbi:MAG: AraC family ligand binding domain-containing protein [Clostridia bacterium]|nr:AraC family ligand binding domain-containing protein [Clostridia bacterium]
MGYRYHCDEHFHFQKDYQSVLAFSFKEYHIPPHYHDFYEINIVLGGRGVHQIETARIPVSRGDVFVIPPATVHSYDNTEHLEVYHIILKNDFIRKNSEEATRVPGFTQLMEIEPYLRKSSPEHFFLHLTPIQIAEVERESVFLEEAGPFGSEELTSLRNHSAWKLIYYLSCLLNEQTKGKGNSSEKYTSQILDTLEYIHQSFSGKITVEGLAERVYLSRSTFIRSFFAVCGCAPMQYVNSYRSKRARELLESSSMSKTEIAHLCGFYDLSHMKRLLEKHNKPL